MPGASGGPFARPQCESRRRAGPIATLFRRGGKRGRKAAARSHATTLTPSSSAGVVVEACWKSARKAGYITERQIRHARVLGKNGRDREG